MPVSGAPGPGSGGWSGPGPRARAPAKGGGERGLTAGAFLPLPSAAGQGPGASLLGGREEEAQEEAAGAEPQLLLHGRQVPRYRAAWRAGGGTRVFLGLCATAEGRLVL